MDDKAKREADLQAAREIMVQRNKLLRAYRNARAEGNPASFAIAVAREKIRPLAYEWKSVRGNDIAVIERPRWRVIVEVSPDYDPVDPANWTFRQPERNEDGFMESPRPEDDAVIVRGNDGSWHHAYQRHVYLELFRVYRDQGMSRAVAREATIEAMHAQAQDEVSPPPSYDVTLRVMLNGVEIARQSLGSCQCWDDNVRHMAEDVISGGNGMLKEVEDEAADWLLDLCKNVCAGIAGKE